MVEVEESQPFNIDPTPLVINVCVLLCACLPAVRLSLAFSVRIMYLKHNPTENKTSGKKAVKKLRGRSILRKGVNRQFTVHALNMVHSISVVLPNHSLKLPNKNSGGL